MSIKMSFIIVLLSVLVMSGCKSDVIQPLSTINQVAVDGAVLPLHIHGNTNSSTMILVVNGGPGQSAILQRRAIGFAQLETIHRIGYLDQRGCGISGGNVDPESMTLAQLAEDLGRVVQLIEASGDVQSLFIIGLDYGCAPIARYLGSSDASSLVKGFIAVSPGFNVLKSLSQSRQEILSEAEALLNDNDVSNDDAAQNVVSFYDQNPVINVFNYEEHVRLLDAINGIVLNTAAPTSGLGFPEYSPSLLEKNEVFALQNFRTEEGHFTLTMDSSDDLININVPVKIIVGAFDRLMPLSISNAFPGLLSASSDDERISVFPASAHRPYLEEGERFFATVNAWVSFYN